MRPALSILDRSMLATAAPAIGAAVIAGGAAWLLGDPQFAFTAAAFTGAVGFALVYRVLERHGELRALFTCGVSPRRACAANVVACVIVAVAASVVACTLRPAALHAGYAGYVLAALQLPLLASIALPATVRRGHGEPATRTIQILAAYVAAGIVLAVTGRLAAWPPGADQLYLDAALVALDVMLYRAINR